MSAAKHNLTIGRGETFSFVLDIADAGGVPVDLTSEDSFSADIRRGNSRPLVAKFVITVDTVNNTITCTLPSSETLKLDGGITYKWDIFWLRDDVLKQLITGDVHVIGNITHIYNWPAI